MKKKDFIESIPLFLLIILGIISIVQVLLTNHIFDGKQFIGITLAFVSAILFFTNRRIYKYIFGITLLLGTVTLISFSTLIITVNVFSIPLQVTVLPSLVIYMIVYKIEIGILLDKMKDKENKSNIKINVFEKKFENLSNKEIDRKLKQDLTKEAEVALMNIKNRRNIVD